uniref:NADH-ubiquinone oxidoreductase chain 4L n=1 Tax=Gari togata TaxID=2774046 RepID=A0A8K0Z4N8_9BIVA|nr:NADH dehydrogenase subunit 4L [Gari togata]
MAPQGVGLCMEYFLFLLMALGVFCLVFIFFQEKHFVMVLLGVELLVLCLYLGSVWCLARSSSFVQLDFCILLLVVAVCDSVYGLSLLVANCRFTGHDQLGNLFCLEV